MSLRETAEQLADVLNFESEYTYEEVEEARAALRKLAVAAITASHRAPVLVTKVTWWKGCHCHGSSGEETIQAGSLAELGKLVAAHEHGELNDLNDAAWSFELTSDEQDEACSVFRAVEAHLVERASLAKEAKEVYAQYTQAVDMRKAAVDLLEQHRPDYAIHAVLREEEGIRALTATVADLSERLAKVNERLVAHDLNAP